MKKHFLRALSMFIVTVMLVTMIVPILPVSAAIDYRTGSNGVSSSYQNGHYWDNLQNIELSGDDATDVIAVALSQLGYQEGGSSGQYSGETAGSGNYTEYNRNTGLSDGEAWCAAFCSWALFQSYVSPHNDSSSWVRNHSGDYNYIWCDPGCNNWANQLKGAGLYSERGSYTPNSGDLIFFNNDGINHIGIVVYCDGSTVYTVEGNTSSAEGLNGEGNGVYYKYYSLSSTYINGYGKLSQKYESADVPKVDYSGANKTPGWYIVRTGQSVSFNGGSIPAHNMFKVLSISGDTATVQYGGSTGTVTLSQSTALQVTASGSSSSSSSSNDFKFGLTDKGVTVKADGSWSVEMYLEGAGSNFAYDAWYGIYDLGVKEADLIENRGNASNGAWDYVIPSDELHKTGLDEGDRLPSKRFTFTFDSSKLESAASGKSNPTPGGTYNLFLFYTDGYAGDGYKVARSIPITIPETPTFSADYEHVILIGVDGAGTFFNQANTPNLDTIFSGSNVAISNTVRTEDPSMSAENWASMLHGVADEYHNIDNDFAYANEYPLDSDYPSVFKVIRENYPTAKLGAFSHWAPINTGIIENGIGVDKTHGLSDAQIAEETVDYIKANNPKFVYVQFDEVDSVGHTQGWATQAQLNKLTELDGYIGQIYKAYQDKGLLDKTLFIVTADHGGEPNTGNHGGSTYEETHVSFFVKGKTVTTGSFDGMMIRDTAAVVLHALDCELPNTYQARVPNNLFNGVSRDTEFDFGVSNVTVNGSDYEIEMYIEGADDRFGHDAWFGIYDGNVTAEDLYNAGGAISQGAWDYVVQGSGNHTTGLSSGTRIGSQRRTFTFKSSNLDEARASSNPAVGGTYTIFLFYTDGHDGYGYVVADSIGVTIKNNDSVSFGLTENGVAVRPDGSYSVEMYLEGADSSYEYDTWYGIYDADVSTSDILSGGGELSQGAWGYVKAQNNENSLNSGKYVFSFDSDDCNKDRNNPVPGKTYNVYLFKCDRGGSNSKQYTVAASFPLHIPANANTGDGYLQFGFTNTSDKIVVNGDGSWTIKMFIDGADSRFDDNAWVGIYNTDITKEDFLAGRADLSQGAWTPIGDFDSSRHEFTFSSSEITSNANQPRLGGTYNLVLFYSDSSPNGYVVARMIPFTLPTLNINESIDFGLTQNGVTVNSNGSWSVEMYLEGADDRFSYDAWFGIYDTSVTPDALLSGRGDISQGAWDYVVQGSGHHSTGLDEGAKFGSGKLVFSFDSSKLDTPADGKSNPVAGGTYKVFLFYTDGYGGDGYTVADYITLSIENTNSGNNNTNTGNNNNNSNNNSNNNNNNNSNDDSVEDTHVHDYSIVKSNETHHWNECACGEAQKKKSHKLNDENKCTVCGYEVEAVEEDTSADTQPSDETTSKKKKGCKSVVATSAISLATVMFVCAGVALKKKED